MKKKTGFGQNVVFNVWSETLSQDLIQFHFTNQSNLHVRHIKPELTAYFFYFYCFKCACKWNVTSIEIFWNHKTLSIHLTDLTHTVKVCYNTLFFKFLKNQLTSDFQRTDTNNLQYAKHPTPWQTFKKKLTQSFRENHREKEVRRYRYMKLSVLRYTQWVV